MTFDQLSVFVENKPGKLLEALEILSEARIDLRALSLADTADFGILRIIVDKPSYAYEVLENAGYLVKLNKVIPVEINDKPGGFAEIMRVLTQAGIEVEYTYAFVSHNREKAYVILRVTDNDIAIKALTDNGVRLLANEDMS
jgi:hypothetical protein